MLALDSLVLIFIIVVFTLILIGIIGYIYIFDQEFIDAFYSTVITMTSLNLGATPQTSAQKVFLALYSIFAVLVYFIFISILVAYIILYHKVVIIGSKKYINYI